MNKGFGRKVPQFPADIRCGDGYIVRPGLNKAWVFKSAQSYDTYFEFDKITELDEYLQTHPAIEIDLATVQTAIANIHPWDLYYAHVVSSRRYSHDNMFDRRLYNYCSRDFGCRGEMPIGVRVRLDEQDRWSYFACGRYHSRTEHSGGVVPVLLGEDAEADEHDDFEFSCFAYWCPSDL